MDYQEQIDKAPSHTACNIKILPARPNPSYPSDDRQWGERTHGCWCASWRVVEGVYYIWDNDDWRRAKSNEVEYPGGHDPACPECGGPTDLDSRGRINLCRECLPI